MKNKKFEELRIRQQYNIGIISGVISGFFIIIIMNFYVSIFNLTKDSILTLLIVIGIISAIIYIGIVRPTNICLRELKLHGK